MDIKVYLCLLILCEISSQGISALSEDNGFLEDLHIRNKRVIGSKPVSLVNAPYVINILANGVNRCTASLLSPDFSITAHHCFELPEGTTYSILSGSPKPNFGKHHNITRTIQHPNYRPHDYHNDVVLVTFVPSINFEQSRNRPIKLFNGPLPPNSHGTITSWGCHMIKREEQQFPNQLRSATVQIISFRECRYLNRKANLVITEHYICTTSENGKIRCDDGDSGAPLVVNGHLVGVMSLSTTFRNIFISDFFVNMLHHDYRTWIAQYVPSALEHGSES